MASTLHVSEGQIIDDAGNRIATLSELGDAERFTALEERIAKVENVLAELTTEAAAPEDPNAPSPPGGLLKIHVGDEVGTPEPAPTP
jgi:hypothetical protein